MKIFAILVATIATIHAGSVPRVGWSTTTTTPPPGWPSTTTTGWPSTTTTGWPSTTTPPPGWPSTTTTGWPSTTTPPPGWPSTTTTGWPSTTTTGWPSTTTPGWGGHKGWQSTTTGWPSTTTTGWPSTTTPGWAAQNTYIDLVGDLGAAGEGWATQNHAESISVSGSGWNPAELSAVSGGEAVVEQHGEISQYAAIAADGSATSLNNISVGQSSTAQEGLAYSASGDNINTAQSGSIATSGSGALGAAGESVLEIN